MAEAGNTGKTVLITGAARGLGKALAECFWSRGWKVIATDIQDFSGVGHDRESLIKIPMDVTDNESVVAAFKQVSGMGIRLDLLINNAGIDGYFPYSEAPVETFRRIFEVNLFGGYRVNRVFLPLIRIPGGRIIHISSESLNLALPFMPYPLSKKALESYAKSLRQELRFMGIGVAVIRPGAINTSITENVHSITYSIGNPVIEKVFRRFAASAPKEIGRIIEPVEAAEFIYRVALKKKLRALYRINNMFVLKLFKLIPFCLAEKIIYRRLK